MQERVSLLHGIRPLVATVVGVGFFSLPYVFAQAGFGIAFGELAFLVLVQILFLHIYADLALVKKHHARFLHIIGDAFGPIGNVLAVMSFFGMLWGAMIACLLTGGEFLSYVARAWIPVSGNAMSLVLGGIFALALLGGAGVVRSVQRYLVPFFFFTIAVLGFFAFPSVSLENLLQITWQAWTLPLGVILFSLSAISAIPEMRDALHGNGPQLRRVIFWGMVGIGFAYAAFSLIVVGITGNATPEQAIAAFAGVAPWMVLLGSLLGLSTVTTAYINVGSALINTLLFDAKVRFIPAWFFIVSVPFVAVFFGVKNVVGVLEYAGGVCASLLGILVLLAYEKARNARQLPAHTRAVSPLVVFGVFVVFFAMLILTLRV